MHGCLLFNILLDCLFHIDIILMPYAQTWSLSQDANKKSGTCNMCFAIRQLHQKDGTVHKHGPRRKPCSGSHQLPLDGSSHSQHSTNSQTFVNTMACSSPASCSSSQSDNGKSELVVSRTLLQTDKANEPIRVIPDWALTNIPLIKHIPKAVRFSCAKHLTALLNKVSNDPANLEAWKDILTWGRRVIGQLRRSGKRHNAAAVVKKRIVEFDSVDFEVQSSGSNGKMKSTKSTDFRLAEAVAAKLEDGNLRAAVRLLMSDDKPADVSSETLVKLIEKHPPAPAIRQFPDSSPSGSGFCR
jgi:hypothetical protein